MKKWEYKSIEINTNVDNSIRIFNTEGQDSWELIQVQETTNGFIGLFKRQIEE
jgi:hypothetical protein